MTAPAKPKQPPPSIAVTVRLPTMRIGCEKCRHMSPTLVAVGERVEVPLGCRCPMPEIVLVLGFPGRDVNLPLEAVAG